MNDSRSPLRRAVAFAALAVAMVAIVGCARKVTTVNSSYTLPEGMRSDRVVHAAYPDLPVLATEYLDKVPPGPDSGDSLVTHWLVYPEGPGVLHGMVFDGTAANAYQILRRESGGGYAPLLDYYLDPVQRLQPWGWKLFCWTDTRPSSFNPPTYIGRGVVEGAITPRSPLTDPAVASADTIAPMLAALDSNGTFYYVPVRGAASYLIQIYESISGDPYASLHNSAPAPWATKDHRDALDFWLTCTPDGLIQSGRVLQAMGMRYYSIYQLRFSAMDAEGRLLACTEGFPQDLNLPIADHYIEFMNRWYPCWVGVTAQLNFQAIVDVARFRAVPAGAIPRVAVPASLVRSQTRNAVPTTLRSLLSRP